MAILRTDSLNDLYPLLTQEHTTSGSGEKLFIDSKGLYLISGKNIIMTALPDSRAMLAFMCRYPDANPATLCITSPETYEKLISEIQTEEKNRVTFSSCDEAEYDENSRKSLDKGDSFLDRVIGMAASRNAADIHFQWEPDSSIAILFRIEGKLKFIEKIKSSELYSKLVSRLKVLARMPADTPSVAEGNFVWKNSQGDFHVRVSMLPSKKGIMTTLRLHSPAIRKMKIEDLGLSSEELLEIEKVIQKNNGLIIISGPSGAGKTTTLYSLIENFISREKKVITVEDPVEYEIPGISQIQIGGETDLDFPKALKAVLRHDPDIIIVGEIRDQQSAVSAVQYAATGHLVMATIHSLTPESAVERLLSLGAEKASLSTSLKLIVSQRLITKNEKNEDSSRTGIFDLRFFDGQSIMSQLT